jgi:hypothetical protein
MEVFHTADAPVFLISDAQPSTLSYACALKTGLNQVRAITQMPTAHQAELSAVDKQTDTAGQLTYSVPRLLHSNALVPISTLPPELLARIFHVQVLVEPPWSFGVHLLGWIRVTHVCRRWRYVALDDSTLWARISGIPRSTKWLSQILVRAHNTPLCIDLGYIQKREILTRLPPLISHTRELRLRSPSLLRTKGVQDICGLEAPELEHFELGISVTSPVTFLHLDEKPLFKGWTPKLRTLSLTQVLIPWSLLPHPHGRLTELRIMLYSKIPIPDPSSPVDLNQLVELLINSPELEVVILELCLPTILSRPSHGHHIHLPRLSRLHLGGTTSCVTDLSRKFIIPSSASLRLHCISENHPAHSNHLTLPSVSAAYLHHRGSVEFKSLKVTANYFEGFLEVAASISSPESTKYNQHVIESRMDDEAELTISFDGLAKFGPSDWADMLRHLCGHLPVSHLEFLSVTVHETIQSVNWYELFSHCKNITTIQARGRGICGLLQCLAPICVNVSFSSKAKKGNEECEMKHNNRAAQVQVQATNNADGSPTTTPFPKLSCLLLQNLSFDSPIPYSGILVGNVLIDALRWHKMNNSPVKTLSVDSCIITGTRANGLKQYVQEFSWDGDEGHVVAYLEGTCEDHDFTSDFDETGVWQEDVLLGTTRPELE